MGNDDGVDFTKIFLDISKKIASWSRDYIGIPFSNGTQLPFSVNPMERQNVKPRFYSTTKQWQKGDPIVGFYNSPQGKKMVLNLPDGSSILDMVHSGLTFIRDV